MKPGTRARKDKSYRIYFNGKIRFYLRGEEPGAERLVTEVDKINYPVDRLRSELEPYTFLTDCKEVLFEADLRVYRASDPNIMGHFRVPKGKIPLSVRKVHARRKRRDHYIEKDPIEKFLKRIKDNVPKF